MVLMVFCVLQAAAVHHRTAQQEAGGGEGKLLLVFVTSALCLRHSRDHLTLVDSLVHSHSH